MSRDILISLKLTAIMAVFIIIINLIQFNSIVFFILKSLFLSAMWFGLFYAFIKAIEKFLPEIHEVIIKSDNEKIKGEHLDIKVEDDEEFFDENKVFNEDESFDEDANDDIIETDSLADELKETNDKVDHVKPRETEELKIKKKEHPVLNQDDKTLAKAVRTMMKKEE